MDFVEQVAKNVLKSLYTNLGASVLIAFLFMYVYRLILKNGVKKTFMLWIGWFRKSAEFRKVFLLVFYISMMLFRTILCREFWGGLPLKTILGTWGLRDHNGEIYTENIENFVLFVPMTMLIMSVLKERVFNGEVVLFRKAILYSTIISFTFSLMIEVCQLFFKLGTFQLSDLFFNTLGGAFGCVVYYAIL